MVEFFCWSAVVGLVAAFALALAQKWGWIEWAQVHAPNEFIHKLVSCKFCCTWWVSVGISLTLWIATGHWWFIIIPVCSTMIGRNLW